MPLSTIEGYSNDNMMCFSNNDEIQFLMKLGLTMAQAKIYYELVLHGEVNARSLASMTSLPRTEIYRVLSELQEQGLVDREVGSPLKFIAVPPSLGLQAIIDRKFIEINDIQKSLKEFTSEFQGKQERQNAKGCQILIIEGRKRIMTKIKQQHDMAKFNIDIVSFLPRFLLVANECIDNYKRAVERGVKYRIILGLPDEKQELPEIFRRDHKNNNTIFKMVVGNQKVNSAIFDQEQTSFSYYPDKPITESPLLLTNHPSIVAFARNSFDQMWNSL